MKKRVSVLLIFALFLSLLTGCSGGKLDFSWFTSKFTGKTADQTQAEQEAAAAEERLRKGKEELEEFSAAVRAVCDKEIQLLNELPQAPVELPQEEARPEDSVQEIEDSVMAAFSEAAPEEDGDAAETQTEASEPVAEAADSAADTSDPFGDFPDLSSTRQINLDELKFGRNYNT